MKINEGTKLGRYEIRSLIGVGGMGEVYRASDPKIGRDVAIKVLPADFSADKDRVARFEQEAQAAGALNHPNILAIYDVDKQDDVLYVVSELLEGEELRQRLDEGSIPLRKVTEYAQQIVSGLSAAHEKGIVHRDLKPENLFITKDDRVKILDFGLAKLREPKPDAGSSEDATRKAITNPGVVMGTVGYMSPEQVRGQATDHRSDIFSFGLILYEMITGKRAFQHETMAETMSAILKEEPEEITESNSNISPALERIVRRCLEKRPERRFHSAHDLGFALESLSAPTSSSGANMTTAVSAIGSETARSPWLVRILAAAALMLLIGCVVLAVMYIRRIGQTVSTPLRRFALAIPAKAAPNWNDFRVAISPDGTRIAYNCREGNAVSICLQALDSLSVQRVAEGRDALDWFFSPDGESIGIVTEVGLSKVSVHGGEPQMIHRWLATEPTPIGFSWGPDNYILYGTPSGIQRISAAGGEPEQVTRIAADDGVTAHNWPSLLPDGRSALITIKRTGDRDTGGIVNLQDGSVRDLGVSGHGFVYVAPGFIAFLQGTTLSAFEFDLAGSARPSNPTPIIQNVGTEPVVARDGTLVYIPTRGESTARLVWVDRDGRPTAVGNERLDYTHLDLAPDGRRALLNLEGGKIDLIDLQGGTRKLVAKGGFPIWSSNGERVTFSGDRGLEWMPADGSAPPEVLVPKPGFIVPTSWNSVTGELAYYDHRAFEIWIRSADGTTRRFLGGPGRKRSGRFSPDGKWMAFVSDETGDYQVYVTAYPGPGPTVAVSTKGGLSPIWSADGHELFFRLGSKVLTARMSGAQPLGFSAPVELFDGPYTLDLMGHQREDVGPDGRFLMVENSDDFPIVIVQNWPLELGRLVK